MDDKHIYIQIFILQTRTVGREMGIQFVYIAVSIADNPLITSDLILVV